MNEIVFMLTLSRRCIDSRINFHGTVCLLIIKGKTIKKSTNEKHSAVRISWNTNHFIRKWRIAAQVIRNEIIQDVIKLISWTKLGKKRRRNIGQWKERGIKTEESEKIKLKEMRKNGKEESGGDIQNNAER